MTCGLKCNAVATWQDVCQSLLLAERAMQCLQASNLRCSSMMQFVLACSGTAVVWAQAAHALAGSVAQCSASAPDGAAGPVSWHVTPQTQTLGCMPMLQLTKVVRLQGTDSEAASLGELVWAKGDGDCWWPGEMLDPWDMPPGRQLPEGALAGA